MENEMKTPYRTGYTKGLGFGLTLMMIGVLFLGFNFGILPEKLKWIVFSWQMLLIFIGVINLFKRHLVSGVILTTIGTFFIIPRVIETYPQLFPGFNGDFTQVYWPLLLIVAGILIILGKIFGPKWGYEWANKQYHHHHHHDHYSKWENRGDNTFSKNSVFGAGEHIVLDPVFKGGELNAVFGGITLDLRKTTLAEGDTVIDINAVFGGVTILVPETWLVEMHLDAVFGGFEDKRYRVDDVDTSRKLIITGSCVFGGGELRN
jgi:predicted membrane protein